MLAFERLRETSQGSLMVFADDGEPSEPEPVERVTTTRFWIEWPAKGRSEEESPEGVTITVIDSGTWWSSSPHAGSITNGGDPRHGCSLSFATHMLDPAALLASAQLSIVGERTVAGRAAIAVRGNAFPASPLFQDAGLAHMMGEREFVIDAERGIMLRDTCLLDGQPYIVSELSELVFDEPIPSETFVFLAPEGEPIQSAHEAFAMDVMPLDQIAAQVPFSVLAARNAGAEWTLRHSLVRGSAKSTPATTAYLHYVSADHTKQVSAELTTATPKTGSSDARRELVERNGQGYRVRRSPPDDRPIPNLVAFERLGTRIQLTSQELDLEALLGFAATFEIVRSDSPA